MAAPRSQGKVLTLLNSADCANRRVAFIGFTDNIAADARVEAIESILDDFQNFKQFSIGHFMAGKNSQKFSKASFVEFPTEEIARSFLAAAGGKGKSFPFGSGTLRLKAAKTNVNL